MDRQICKLTSNLTIYSRFLQIVQRNHASKQATLVQSHILMNSTYVIVTTYFMLNNSGSWWWLLTYPTDTRSYCNNSILFYYVWNVHSSVSYYFISLYSDHSVSNSPLVIPILTFAPVTAEVLKIVFRLSNSRQNSLEGGSDHCNTSVTIGKQEQEWQCVPKCVLVALDWVLISYAWPSVDADEIPRL